MTIKIIDGKDMGLAIDTIILLRELFPGATYRHRIDIFSRRLNFITILEVPDDIKPDFDKISWRIKHGQEPPASPGNPKEKPGVEGGTPGPGTGRGTGAELIRDNLDSTTAERMEAIKMISDYTQYGYIR